MSASKFALPSITVAAREEIRVIQVPTDLTQEERVTVIASWISTLGAGSPTHRAIVECVYNLLLMGLPEMSSITNSFTSLKYVTLKPARSDLLSWIGASEDPLSVEGKKLPLLFSPVREEAYSVTREESVYIALSSILFCIGRQASESARASVIDNRPDALIRRFQIPEEEQVILPGRSSGPSREMLEGVYNAFSNYTEVRQAIVLFFLALKREGHHLPLHMEIMMTNFQLMRGSGMTHVEAVTRLARSHPWTLKVPELQPYYYKFTEDLAQFEEIEEDIRPYHRLLVPQSQYLFLSSELRPLVAVAGSFHEDIEKTFSGYVYNKANYLGLIDKVKSYAPNYKPTSSLAKLAFLLGVEEVDLPEKKGKTVAVEEETV